MPTYEYECEKCGLHFEEFQSITAKPLTKCKNSACDGTVKRLFSAGAGFIFKGSGFYSTDYRSDSYKKAARSDGGSSSSSSGSSKKTETATPSSSSESTSTGSTTAATANSTTTGSSSAGKSSSGSTASTGGK